MSLAADLSGLARDLVTSEGTPITFTRIVEGDYDAVSNQTTPPTPLTWAAVGMWTKNKNTTTATQELPDGTSQSRITRTLLVPGLGIIAPMTGDVVVVQGTQYVVGPVTNISDTDGTTVPLYRVEVFV